ncbi:MAG: hypothetical protein RL562_3339 [Planctomycetota bacterium]
MKALVVGCGDVGTRLGLAWAAAGCEVFGVRRSAAPLPAPIHTVSGDVRDSGTYDALPSDLDHVVYAVAARPPGDEGAYRHAYVDGVRAVLEHLCRRGSVPRSLVFASSTSVYGQEDGGWVDEGSETMPADFRGRLLLDAERLVRSWGPEGRVVRLAGIYGPGRTHMIDAVRTGGLGCAADGASPWTNRIHADDAARLLRFVAERPAGAPQVFVGADREPAQRDDVVRWLAERLGVTATHGGAARTRGGNKRCSSALVRQLGFVFRYPDFRAGYGALLGAS